jgi:thioredoxin-like negative regulator of GroEL
MNMDVIRQKNLSLIYITSKNCNVCKAVFPRLEKMINVYPKCVFLRLETDDHPKIAGELMIFTVPAVLIFSQGKEIYRAARFIKLQEIEQFIKSYYEHRSGR